MTSLLDRLLAEARKAVAPLSDEQILKAGLSRRERDALALAYVGLAFQIRTIGTAIAKARAADDLATVQAGSLEGLLALHDALTPLTGTEPLKFIVETAWVFEAARNGHAHHLTARPQDAAVNQRYLPIRQDCPTREMVNAVAAAILWHFKPKTEQLGLSRRQIAVKIGEALGRGGFCVQYRGERRPPSGSTIEAELKLLVDGNPDLKRRAVPETAKRTFEEYCSIVHAGAGDHDNPTYFEKLLGELEAWCRSVAPLPVVAGDAG